MKAIGFGAILWDDIGAAGKPANIGGSVFNVIAHLKKLGGDGYMLSSIGDDSLGKITIEKLKQLGIHQDFISIVSFPTCIIPVKFDGLGLPHYSTPDNVSWDQISVTNSKLKKMNDLQFACLIYGTLEQRSATSRKTLEKVFNSVSFRNKYIDLTLRGNFYSKKLLDNSMRQATILKMNEEEALEVKRLFNFSETKIDKMIKQFQNFFNSKVVIITLGRKGVIAVNQEEVIYKKTYKVDVVDTVGSGDAFSAGFLYKYLNGTSLEQACDFGNRLASVISSKKSSLPDYELSEIYDLDTLEEV